MLEAARYGKCIVNGPYYDNFTEIVDDMIELDSIIIVENADHFLSQATILLTDKERRIQLGNNARKFLSDKSSVADEYTQWIMNYINPHSS
jgi:3-deoxy-D-manno-octulosonic-acid transferase